MATSTDRKRPEIGQAIRDARENRGLPRELLAVHLGISSSMLARLELTGQLPNVIDLASITRFLNLSMDELFDPARDVLKAKASA